MTLKLASAPAGTATVTVNYAKPSSNALVDRGGTEVASFGSAKSVTNNVANFQSAELAADGVTLTLTYDEALDGASLPAASAFQVKVNSARRDLAATTPVSISGSTVVLKLATPARTGETVTLSYTKPSQNPLQETAGNDVANLTDEPVTNNSAFSAKGKPAVSGVRRVGELLSATKGTLADPQGLTKADAGDVGYAYEYQWVRVDGTTETDISGGTSSTYTLAAEDEGKKVRVRVSFTNDEGNAHTLTSDPYPAGADSILPEAMCEAPTYAGGARELWNSQLTMGTDDAGKYGFGEQGGTVYGALAPDDFTLDSTTYTIERATRQNSRSTLFQTSLRLDTAIPAVEVPRLVLYDCDAPLPLSSASGSGRRAFSWSERDVADWSTYSTRTLRLSHDDVAPTLDFHDLVGAVITLTFSEDLDEGSVPSSRAFAVQVEGVDAALASTSPVAVSGATVTIRLASAPALTDEVTLQYTVPSSNPLRDPRHNEVQAVDPLEVGYDGPILVSAKLDGTSLKLTFHEPFDETKVPAGSAFDVQVGAAAAALASPNPVAVSGDTVTLTLASAPAATATVTVDYDKPAVNALADTDGNELNSFPRAMPVTNNVPVYQSAALAADGATLTLTYDEALDAGSVPAASAFAVNVNASAASLAGTSSVDVTGSTVVLMLATPAREGNAVTVSCTRPASNPVQDSAGNDAANLTDETVANGSTLNATGKPTVSGGRRVGDLLSAAKGTLADPQGLTKADAGDAGYAYEYQWVHVDGTTETDISGAASSTYTLAAEDEGKKVRVRVSFTDDADNNDALASDPYPAGADSILPEAVCEAPTYTGGARELWNSQLTMGTDDAGKYGFGEQGGTVYGALAPGEFTLDSTTYTIERATRQNSHSTLFQTSLRLDTAIPAVEVPRLVLYDCDAPLPLSSASGSGRRAFSWSERDVADWSTYSTRTLRLSHDDVAPTLTFHDLVGAVITLTFSEDLDEGSVPGSGAFAVQVEGVDAALASTSPVAVSGATVTIRLASAPALTDEVTLQYTVPSSNPLRDPRHNEVQPFGPLQIGFEGPVLVSTKVNGRTLTLGY